VKNLISTLLLSIFLCFATKAQTVYIVDYEGFKSRIEQNSDTTYVVNFWATWCKPCIEEMPVFEALIQKTINRPVKVLMVSLDFIQDLSKLKEFLKNNPLKTDVFLLNAPDQNAWIGKIDASWSGGIPATLVLNKQKSKRKFIEKQVKLTELEAILQEF
jgi:thiol-disulfide isomerase/thioredoxin